MKILKITKTFQLLFFLITISNIYAAKIINCNSVATIRTAMQDAIPGDEIVIKSGTYNFTDKIPGSFTNNVYLFSNKNGTAANPIIIRGESSVNPPLLQGTNTSDVGSYLFNLSGDYWIIKDLQFKTGAKGVVLDNSNYSKIINVTVSNVGDEAIHLRDGSSHCLIDRCKIFDTGRTQPKYGEGIYVGSDRGQHIGSDGEGNKYNRNCDYNTIENCTVGPNVTAEGVDVKEGTRNTIIRNCTFNAEGISGENSADSFIDLKGMYGIVYKNIFNTENAPKLVTIIDFSERAEGSAPEEAKTGFRDAIFDNIMNLGSRATGTDAIATLKKASGSPLEIHLWDNTRKPASPDFPRNDGTEKRVTLDCPNSWGGLINCKTNTLGIEDSPEIVKVSVFPNPSSNIIKISGLSESNVDISIYNLQGQTVLANNEIIPNNGIDISGLLSGIYVLKIKGIGNGTLFSKI